MAVVTSFTHDSSYGGSLTVNFTDTSTGSPTDFFWDFGDGNIITVYGSTNPVNTYTTDACSVY